MPSHNHLVSAKYGVTKFSHLNFALHVACMPLDMPLPRLTAGEKMVGVQEVGNFFVDDSLRGVKDWVLPLQSYQQISCGCGQLNACASNLHIITRKHT